MKPPPKKDVFLVKREKSSLKGDWMVCLAQISFFFVCPLQLAADKERVVEEGMQLLSRAQSAIGDVGKRCQNVPSKISGRGLDYTRQVVKSK